jgi:hypothetical protein
VAALQPTTLLASGLLSQALAVIDDTATGSRSPEALRRVALLARQTGALGRAAAAARELAALAPQDEEAAYVAAMLAGMPTDRKQAEWPANFIRITNYLAPDRYERLLSELAPASGALTESVIYRNGTHVVAPERRRSTSTPALDPMAGEFRRSILERLPEWCARLGMPPFGAEIGTLKLTRYGVDDYFRRHQDDATGSARPLGFVYYLQFPGQTFLGGELILYDGCSDPCDRVSGWTAVPPEPNSLVILPSWHWHEVAPVRAAPPGGPLSGRFTLNGWLFRAADDGGAAHRAPVE